MRHINVCIHTLCVYTYMRYIHMYVCIHTYDLEMGNTYIVTTYRIMNRYTTENIYAYMYTYTYMMYALVRWQHTSHQNRAMMAPYMT